MKWENQDRDKLLSFSCTGKDFYMLSCFIKGVIFSLHLHLCKLIIYAVSALERNYKYSCFIGSEAKPRFSVQIGKGKSGISLIFIGNRSRGWRWGGFYVGLGGAGAGGGSLGELKFISFANFLPSLS